MRGPAGAWGRATSAPGGDQGPAAGPGQARVEAPDGGGEERPSGRALDGLRLASGGVRRRRGRAGAGAREDRAPAEEAKSERAGSGAREEEK